MDTLDLLNKLRIIVLISPILFAILSDIIPMDATNKTTLFYYVIFLSIHVMGVITLVRFLFIMKQEPSLSQITSEIVIAVLIFSFIWIFYIPHGGPAEPTQCTFPPGFTCVTNKLQAGTAQLYLVIGQGTGHPIRVNGIKCTQNTSSDFARGGIV
jgi:heme/copper-type cytochrome/quinol oxidase subunit 2